MSRPSVFTAEFLLWAMRIEWKACGGDPVLITPDLPLFELFEADDDDGFMIIKLVRTLEEILGANIPWSDFWLDIAVLSWEAFLRQREEILQQKTVGTWIDSLLARTPQVSFAPLALPGAAGCEAAGCFLGMRDLVWQQLKRDVAIAPSTRIHSVMQGKELIRFVKRLSWFAARGFYVREPNQFNLGGTFKIVAILSGAAAIVMEIGQPGTGWLLVLLLWSWKFFEIGKLLQRTARILPQEIETFGDLARVVARYAVASGHHSATLSQSSSGPSPFLT